MRAVETKRYARMNDSAFTPLIAQFTQLGPALGTAWVFQNIFSTIGAGVGSYQIVGNEILNPMIKIKGRVRVDWGRVGQTVLGGPPTIGVCVAIVAANEQYVNTSPTVLPNWGSSSDPGWFYNPNAYNPTFNGNNVKVLKRKLIAMHPQIPTTSTTVFGNSVKRFSMSYRWKRKLTYEDDPATIPSGGSNTGGPVRTGVLRGWNYYVLVGWAYPSNPSGTASSNPGSEIYMDQYVYYKDP